MFAPRDLNGKIFQERVPGQGAGGMSVKELLPGFPLRIIVIDDPITEISGETFV